MAVVILVAGCGAGRSAAEWTFVEGFTPTPTSTELRIVANWRGCANGAAVEAPVPEVTYSATQVTLTVWGTAPAGTSFSCPANAPVQLTVPLTEPLGNRKVVQGATELR